MDTEEENLDVEIFTADEMLKKGLTLVGYTDKKLDRAKKQQTNVDRFRSEYGADPHVLAQIWEDLQTTSIQVARLEPAE